MPCGWLISVSLATSSARYCLSDAYNSRANLSAKRISLRRRVCLCCSFYQYGANLSAKRISLRRPDGVLEGVSVIRQTFLQKESAWGGQWLKHLPSYFTCKPFCKKNQLEAAFLFQLPPEHQSKPFCKKNQLEAESCCIHHRRSNPANLSAKRISLRRRITTALHELLRANLSAKRISLRRNCSISRTFSLTGQTAVLPENWTTWQGVKRC